MSRPVSVTASAVVDIVGSVLTLLFGCLMIATAFTAQANVPNYRELAIVMGLICVALAALGIWTAVGLLKLRAWARVSILVFAGIMAAFSLFALVVVSVMPIPAPNLDQPAAEIVRRVLIGIYVAPALIGIWWLVLFNRRSIRELFAAGVAPGQEPTRPLSISIIGWWNVLAGALCVIPVLLRLPAFVAGFILTGWSATLLYVVFGAISGTLGWRLLKLDERARVLTIAWLALTGAHAVLMAVAPRARARLREFESSLSVGNAGQPPPFDPVTFSLVFSLLGLVLIAVAIWFLVRSKPAFKTA